MDVPALNIDDCTGCKACYNACEFNAIEMKMNEEGFTYPEIDSNKCVKCYKCIYVCPTYLKNGSANKKTNFYAGYSKNSIILKNSASGGLFMQIAMEIIKKDGWVFGAAFDKDLNVKHRSVKTLNDLKLLGGSKYIQSNTMDTYLAVKRLLECDKIILYSGTPCQIAGLYTFLGKDYNNLYTIDIVCHGIPSPGVFLRYKKTLEEKYKSKIKKINFRDKKNGWAKYSIKIVFENGKIINEQARKNQYFNGFLKNLYLRKSCYNCKYKKLPYYSDITLGDFWGVKKKYPKLYNKNGVSLLIENSDKGFELIQMIKNYVVLKGINEKFAVKNNLCIIKSVKGLKAREKFFADYSRNGFDYAYKEFLKRS